MEDYLLIIPYSAFTPVMISVLIDLRIRAGIRI